jgi:tripartite-type tricarboxylate transporter receptor subunit TctC
MARIAALRVMVPTLALASTLAIAWGTDAGAQPAAAPFPAGKPVSVHVGVNPGGGNDQIMRLVARHIGSQLPGQPAVVPRNTPGAGGRRLAGLLANTLPRDGTEIAMLHRGLVREQLLGDVALPFKLQDLTWLGTPSAVNDTCIAWHTARAQTIADLRQHELVIAGDGNEAWQVQMLQRLVGAKVRTVLGYPGGTEMNLAMERGEVGGRCGYSWQALKAAVPEWLRDRKVRPFVQFAMTRHPELSDVPLILDFATTDRDREAVRLLMAPQVFGFPFAAPPGLLPEVRDLLRKAFDLTMQDQRFRDDAVRVRLEPDPGQGQELERVARVIFAAPPEIIARARQLIAPN